MTAPMAQPVDAVLTARDKGVPERAMGMTIAEFLATQPRLDEFWTPLIVLDDAAMRHNVETMASWCAQRGLAIMPHGKTTMAPALWQRQIDAGALGITLATIGQVRTARSFGAASLQLANAAVDERSLRWLASELADPDFRFVSWVDSVETVEAMAHGLRGASRPVDVLVELGADGGRTGARTIEAAVAVAERVAATPALRLAGVAGYEGSLAHERTDAALNAVRTYLQQQVELHERIRHLYGPGDVYLTAGGSAYFDVVAEVYADVTGAHRVLRSGAYVVHDDGFYRQISPFDEGRASDDAPRFRTAMRGVARVVSHPESGLALLDGGKRDFPYDEGLPIPRAAASDLGAPWRLLDDATISAMNDQHSYLRADVPVGAVVALGLSHPCTAFDKWRVLPVVDDGESGRVIDLVRTYF
ncbi:alanine racemase [Microbacterium horticulturae]|uniref:Alanine racemase n=1 Tax=Microbacterium horticulturae TaxID=3028316 RepID=A0ABY8BXE9_9MICO|nr:alanine racemase [Microbacterium sp. KACC 23027]WEG08839.1 alanine racemase [Microbacterium sp. KACC 23027]